jgi:hypothetical protein
MKHRKLVAALMSVVTLMQGCATSGKSTLFGAGAGTGMGAGIGAMVDPGPKGKDRIRNVFIGATAGGLIGASAGYAAHSMVDGREKDAYDKGKNDGEKILGASAGTQGTPTLLPPKVESRFVDEQVRGNVYIPAHFEYIIVEPARWSN